MQKPISIPRPCDTSEIRIVDLSKSGIPFIPVFAHTHYSRPGADVAAHRHNGFIEILFCRRGDHASCESDGREIAFRPGDVFVAQPEHRHYLRSSHRGLDVYWLWVKLFENRQFPHISPSESRELQHSLRTLPPRFTGGDRIRRAFKDIWEGIDLPETPPLRSVRIRLAVYNLLLALTDAASKPELPHDSTFLDTIINEMCAHPERSYPIDELSRRVRVNSVYLNQLFKRATGLPPHAYLTSLRIEAAKKLLSTGNRSVTSIARRLGYPSSQHFAAQFRRETNFSPSDWRRKIATQIVEALQ